MNVSGTWSYDDSDRDIDLSDYLADGWEDALLDAYLDGADVDELGELLHGFITDDFYSGLLDPNSDNPFDIDDMDWGD